MNFFISIYTQALAKYLDVESSLNLDEIIDKAKRKNNDDLNLFIDWFERKGRKTILDISKIEIPENEDFMAQIEYEIYILRENLESEDLEDLRALFDKYYSRSSISYKIIQTHLFLLKLDIYPKDICYFFNLYIILR